MVAHQSRFTDRGGWRKGNETAAKYKSSSTKCQGVTSEPVGLSHRSVIQCDSRPLALRRVAVRPLPDTEPGQFDLVSTPNCVGESLLEIISRWRYRDGHERHRLPSNTRIQHGPVNTQSNSCCKSLDHCTLAENTSRYRLLTVEGTITLPFVPYPGLYLTFSKPHWKKKKKGPGEAVPAHSHRRVADFRAIL